MKNHFFTKTLFLRIIGTALIILFGLIPYTVLKYSDGSVDIHARIIYMKPVIVILYSIIAVISIILIFIRIHKLSLIFNSTMVLLLVILLIINKETPPYPEVVGYKEKFSIGFYLHIITLIYYVFLSIVDMKTKKSFETT